MHIRIRRGLSALLVSAAVPVTVGAQRAVPDAYAITNARIVTVGGPTLELGTVVFRNGVITAVGANASVPADARVIDGSGLTVYPGLIDAYSSIGIPSAERQGGGRQQGGGAPAALAALQGGQQQQPAAAPNSLYPPGLQPELVSAELIRPDAEAFANARGVGITTALTAPATGIFMGQSALINLHGDNAQEMLVKAPVAMHVGFTPLRGQAYPNSLLGVFSAVRQMLLDAQRYGELQRAYARNPRGMRRPEHDQSLAALQPVLAREIPVVMLASTQREIERALDLAKEFNLRVIIAGGLEAHTVAARLKAENVPVLHTLNFPRRPENRNADADPEPLRVLRERVDAPKGPSRLQQAGVRFAFQSGGMSSWADFLTNASRAVESGLTKDQAIRALTLAPAEILGVQDRLGSIEPGKIANLTVVRGDLFDRGARVTQVFVDGRPAEARAPAAGARGGAGIAAGTWTVTVTLDGVERAVTVALQQEGERLRGTLQGALGTSQINDGSVGANGEFRFTASVTLQGGTEEATFSGTITGSAMRGTVQVVGHASGTFVGTKPQTDAPRGGPGGRRPPQEDGRDLAPTF